MEKKKLKRLSRKELLEMLIMQGRELQSLEEEYAQLQSQTAEENKSEEQERNSPNIEELEEELERVTYYSRYKNVLLSTVYILIVVAAVAVLIATIWLPVLQIYGSSMNPTLEEGNIVVAVKGSDFEQGDLVAFYLGNKILVKRYIAGPGQWVDMDSEGNVYVDGVLLEETYLTEKALGDYNIEFPYQVPDNRYFCLGDHRSTSVDSRHTNVGCISEEQMIGKIVFRVWPFYQFGKVE